MSVSRFRGVLWPRPASGNGIYSAAIGGIVTSRFPISGTEGQFLICSPCDPLIYWLQDEANLLEAPGHVYKLGTMDDVLCGLGPEGAVTEAISQIRLSITGRE